ncbi:MAG TPA: hypothetical protein VNM16_04680 [Bacillota bacterium]|nr:hypothetical protein [Bacillota bacterium]
MERIGAEGTDALRKKHDVLVHLGMVMPANPEVAYLIGFLAGRLERVHIVEDLEGAPVAIRFAAGRRRLWPGVPFQGVIRGVPVPSPAMVVSALLESAEDICVRIDAEEVMASPDFADVVEPSFEALAEPERPAERAARLRARIDQTLDVYRACREALAEGDAERAAEVRVFLGMAEREIQALSRQLGLAQP